MDLKCVLNTTMLRLSTLYCHSDRHWFTTIVSLKLLNTIEIKLNFERSQYDVLGSIVQNNGMNAIS